MSDTNLFDAAAKWIWDGGDRHSYHRYVRARRVFSLSQIDLAKLMAADAVGLSITADAYYQVAINGHILGSGPAKSAAGRRSVDRYDHIAQHLHAGTNELTVLALSVGVGTMTYCPSEQGAGLIFQLDLGDRRVVSDELTEMSDDPQRQRRTPRRWLLPGVEDVDAEGGRANWRPAQPVASDLDLYARRVPLPTREPLSVSRIVACDRVELPNVQVTFRIKPYLVDKTEARRCNTMQNVHGLVITDVVSPIDQTLTLVPTLGAVTWYLGGKKVVQSSGWSRWHNGGRSVKVKLRKGANRLVGVHVHNHFEDVSFAGVAKRAVEFKNPFGPGGFQALPLDAKDEPKTGPKVRDFDFEAFRTQMPRMDAADTMVMGNAQDLAVGAKSVADAGKDAALRTTLATASGRQITLPAAAEGQAVRLIVDLGVMHNGHLAFDTDGSAGSRLIFAMFEALKEQPELTIQWPSMATNAPVYRLAEGSQSFETMFPYGVRYIAIHHTGPRPVTLRNLRVLTANCGSTQRGSFLCDEPILNEVYKVCAQSVISGTDDTFTDCPTYEQVNWNCDNRLTATADYHTCANTEVAANTIKLFAEDDMYPGLVRGQYPSTWESQIPLWSFHWIMWCWDHYWYTGDKAFVKAVLPQVRAGIDEALGMVNDKGLLAWPDTWHLTDWGRGRDDNHAIVTSEQAGLAGALTAAAGLAQLVEGKSSKQAKAWKKAHGDLAKAVDKHLWVPKRKAYADSLHEDGKLSEVSSEASNAAVALHGLTSKTKRSQIAKTIASGKSKWVKIGSPFGLWYLTELLHEEGEVEALFGIIRHRWGDIVLEGDTCTWETFAEFGGPLWPTRSRCHPYASFAAKYLARHVLGVEPTASGWSSYRVKPTPPKGINSASGSVPTPAGPLRVAWTRSGQRLKVEVDAPRGLKRVK